MTVDPAIVLESLMTEATPRVRNSLLKLNSILQEYSKEGGLDYSVTTIGRLSSEQKGPGYSSIRATRNAHYRRLIEAWAAKGGTDMKKPISQYSRQRVAPSDLELLDHVTDKTLRAIFGQIIAERNNLKHRLNTLNQEPIIIDKRPIRYSAPTSSDQVEVLPALSNILTKLDIQALRHAISEDNLGRMKWTVTEQGQVLEEGTNREVFGRGYIGAIKKVLGEIDSE